jgi:hypothetical protein
LHELDLKSNVEKKTKYRTLYFFIKCRKEHRVQGTTFLHGFKWFRICPSYGSWVCLPTLLKVTEQNCGI